MNVSKLVKKYNAKKNLNIKIAVLGAPGSGKSTVSSGLLYFSKLFRFKCDAVPEVAKWDVYKKRDMTSEKYEMKKFKRQKELEEIFPEELDILICEAPLIISVIFSTFYLGEDNRVTQKLYKKAEKHKHRYSHYFVTRKLFKYFENFARNEDENASEGLHKTTLKILEKLEINYTIINKYDDHVPLQILEMIGAIDKITD